MPKIQWERLPREKWAHLRDRAKERKISQEDLFELAEWKAQDPEVPDGDWYKDSRAKMGPRDFFAVDIVLTSELPQRHQFPAPPSREFKACYCANIIRQRGYQSS